MDSLNKLNFYVCLVHFRLLQMHFMHALCACVWMWTVCVSAVCSDQRHSQYLIYIRLAFVGLLCIWNGGICRLCVRRIFAVCCCAGTKMRIIVKSKCERRNENGPNRRIKHSFPNRHGFLAAATSYSTHTGNNKNAQHVLIVIQMKPVASFFTQYFLFLLFFCFSCFFFSLNFFSAAASCTSCTNERTNEYIHVQP